MAKTLTPQTPGEAAQEPVEAAPAVDDGEKVTVSKSELTALMARVNALEARPPVQNRAAQQENLPDQDSVDPTKIERPVLTKQGWVVPAKFGSNPNQPK